MVVYLKEIPYGAYKDMNEVLGSNLIKKLRKTYHNNCHGLALVLKYMFNNNNILAEVITFKNGSAFNGINVNGNTYTHHTVVLFGDSLIDLLHSDDFILTAEYINKLQEDNSQLRIDYALSSGWYGKDGYKYNPTLQELIEYKYEETEDTK